MLGGMVNKTIISAFNRCVSFVFPITCAGCGDVLPADDKLRICARCFSEFKYVADGLFCGKCGKPLISGGATCWNCKKEKRSFDLIRSALIYDGITRGLLHKYKYKGCEHLSRLFGWFLASSLQSFPELKDFDVIIPVPMHKIRKISRGYNQSALAAYELSRAVKKEVFENVLNRSRFTRQQAKLTRSGRLENVADAFSIKRPEIVHGKNVLLIDDVVTTCATIENCSRALKNAGAKKVYGLTIAHD